MISSIRRCLQALAIPVVGVCLLSSSLIAAPQQVITLRSGQVGGVPGPVPTSNFVGAVDDSFHTLSSLGAGALMPGSFGAVEFAASLAGPPAELVVPNSGWLPTLACDPQARWINFDHGSVSGGSGVVGSALYTASFSSPVATTA